MLDCYEFITEIACYMKCIAMICLVIFTYALWKYELNTLLRTYRRLDKLPPQGGTVT